MNILKHKFEQRFLTTEAVSQGHPDKTADQIAEAICDFCLKKDVNAHVACEVFIDYEVIFIGGELKSSLFQIDDAFKKKIKQIVWKVINKEIGFTHLTWDGLSRERIKIEVRLHSQSEEINHLVQHNGAGDNSTVFGFANSDLNYFPVFQHLANKVLQKINQVRKTNQSLQKQLFFAPDGKIQILFQTKPNQVRQITLCQQFTMELNDEQRKQIEKQLKINIIQPVLNELKLNNDYFLVLKDFFKGGPLVDSGLTGRKLMVDNYGIFSPHGGGSFAGKDPSKTDRSLALFARFVAKHLVATGLVKEVTVQISSIIGQKEPVNISIFSIDPSVNLNVVEKVVKKFFFWNIGKIITELKLVQTTFFPFASYGYFGRSDFKCSWEDLTYLSAIKNWLKEKI